MTRSYAAALEKQLRMLSALAVAAALGPFYFSMPGHPDWSAATGAVGRRQVIKALGVIPTATGVSAYKRMNACGFKIEWSVSWVEPSAAFDSPNAGVKKGDTTIQVLFERPHADEFGRRDNLARWYVTKGRLIAGSGWAEQIQSRPYPINQDGGFPC